MQEINLLLVTKGHPFERGPFFDFFDSLGFNWTHVEQPAARVFFTPDMARDYDVLVMYDMPGIKFGAAGPEFEEPSETYKQGFIKLLESGKGFVFMHHAIAGWPAWSEYAEIVGGSFLYVPGELRGEKRKDSGYRHEVEHTVTRLTDHALTRNLPSEFSMTDELYLYEVFEDSVIPILASQHEFSAGNFYSAAKVVLEGKMFNNDNWDHDTGSNLVAWVKNYANSPIAYIQGGDDPVAWQSSEYQQLVRNAITWAASNEALTWARQRP